MGLSDTEGAFRGAELAALVASRLCHDLVNPLGAIGNGVELLALEGGRPGAELALIGDAVAQATARVRFLRVAFGVAAGGAPMGAAEARAILAGATAGGRLAVDWTPAGEAPREAVRLAFLAVMCLEAAMPRGGRIAVAEAGGVWTVLATAARMRAEAGPFAALGAPGGPGAVSPATVQFALLHAGAAALGRRVAAVVTPTGGRIAF